MEQKIIYLLKKTHPVTGLNYLCITTRKDYHRYSGSGVHWKNHLKKHGWKHHTEVLKECKNQNEVEYWGEYYSNLYNVVDSDNWANLVTETGKGGSTELAKMIWNRLGFREKMQMKHRSYRDEEYRNARSKQMKEEWAKGNRKKPGPGLDNPRADKTLYTFTHIDGTTITATRWEFCEQFNLRKKAIMDLVNNKFPGRKYKGWTVEKKEDTNCHR